MKEFNIICAVSMNGIIGDSTTNSIPWYLPADLKHFKELTTGKTIVMGAKTYNSLGRNLPNRKNVVITRGNTQLVATPHATHASLADAMRTEDEGFFLIGGEHFFRESLSYLPKTLHITVVKIDGQGDVRFPIEGRRFTQDAVHVSDTTIYNCINRSPTQNDGGIDFEFTTFERK